VTAPTVARITLTPVEAAQALGISRDSFDRYVAPELRLVRRGRLVLVPVTELEKWVAREAALTLQLDR
jgi:excisionase family DNA binding protein